MECVGPKRRILFFAIKIKYEFKVTRKKKIKNGLEQGRATVLSGVLVFETQNFCQRGVPLSM